MTPEEKMIDLYQKSLTRFSACMPTAEVLSKNLAALGGVTAACAQMGVDVPVDSVTAFMSQLNLDTGDGVDVEAAWAKFREINRDAMAEGGRLAFARYAAAPIDPKDLAAVLIGLVFTVKFYASIGRDSVPIHECAAVLDRLM